MKGLLLLTVIVAAATVPNVASAWNYIDSSGPRWCGEADYALQSPGSADMGIGTTEAEVQRGMDDWSRVACSGLRTRYTGQTSSSTSTRDDNSVIGWLESSWGSSSSAIGVTIPQWSFRPGERPCIVNADMEMNGVNYTWITGPGDGRGTVNAYSIILHEGGHFMGLGHSSVSGATMDPSYSGGIDALTADDEAGICNLYPASGVDCTTAGCPGGFECISGTCEAIRGDGTLCSPCTESSECGGPQDLCIRLPDGNSYCTTACSSPSDCGENSCFGTSAGGGQCAPADATGNPTCAGFMPTGPECTTNANCAATELCDAGGSCVPRPVDLGNLGDSCTAGSECNSGECIPSPEGSFCSDNCDWLDPSSCGAGYYCDGEALGTCGSGRCVLGSAGTGGLEAACGQDTDCDSLYCVDGTCAEPCVPGGVDACADGYSCLQGTLPLPSCGYCQMAGAVGDACVENRDCASGQCAERGDITFCTAFCTEMTDCPESFTCAPAGDVSVCAPPAGYVPPTGMTPPVARDRGGCGCDVPGGQRQVPWALFLTVPALIWLRRRRKG